MPKQKATDIAILKKHFRENDQALAKKINDQLEPEIQQLYENLMHTTWVPSDSLARLYQVIAQIVFPGDANQIQKLGQMAAQKSFTGVYRTFLKTPTIDSIKQRIGVIWNTYHAQGQMVVEKEETNHIVLLLKEYPEIPLVLKQVTMGHLSALFGLAGVQQLEIKINDSNDQAIQWELAWADEG